MKSKKQKKQLETKRIHPFWLLLSLMLGLCLAIIFKTYIPIVVLGLLGIFMMLIFKTSPSKATNFNKTKSQSIVVWFIALIIIVLLAYIYYVYGGF